MFTYIHVFLSHLILPPDINKQSTCLLEVDVVHHDIMNQQFIKGKRTYHTMSC